MSDITNYELPPVDVTDWVQWHVLWAKSFQLLLHSGKTFGPPQSPEEYQEMVTYINSLLNSTQSGGSVLPAVKEGSTLLPAVAENTQALIGVIPTDPANVGTISAQPITDIAVGGGSIGAVIAKTAGGSYGTVKNTVAALSVASILATTIGAFQMAQEKIEDLFFAVDPYVDDNDNVMTYTDENGKTYLPHDFIEAIRQKLIEMGAYSTGELDPVPPTPSGFSIPYLASPLEAVEWYANARGLEIRDVTRANLETFSNDYWNGQFFRFNVSVSGDIYEVQFDLFDDIRVNTFTVYVGQASPYNAYGYRFNQSYSFNHYSIFTRINWQYNSSTNPDYYIIESDAVNFPTTQIGNVFKVPAGGVEGITIQEGATVPVDPTQTLEDYFPAWTGEGKVFNTVTLGADRAIQSIGETTFLPATLKDVQPFEEGTTQDQTQAQAGTPQETPDITNNLLPAIQEFIETIINSPDIPTPTIPAGDSGDTPPENPPLTPPSDVTGSNGLWSIYNPSLQNVNDFGAWLWSDSLADQFKRIFNSPIDGVIGFHMLYCTPTTGTAKPIKCGFLQSPVTAPVVTNPYVEINCGTVSIGEYYGNAMDYDNTRISVYLPFVGIVPLDTNIVMGSDINITYRIDVLTGTCLAQIKVLKENSDAVMYAFDGNCAVQIPLTATTYTGMIGALLGGISAGASIMTGNMVQAIGSGMRALASGMTGLSGAKQSGTFGANVGALGIRIPYVIITHPVSAMPYQFNKLEGLPSNTAVTLGSLSGFTRVRSVHLENIGNATQEEIQMIQEQLEQGVII